MGRKDASYLWECVSSVSSPRNLRCMSNTSSPKGLDPTDLDCFMRKCHFHLDGPLENVASSPEEEVCKESDVSEITRSDEIDFPTKSEPIDNAQAKEAAEHNKSVHMAQIAQRARWSVRGWRGAPIILF